MYEKIKDFVYNFERKYWYVFLIILAIVIIISINIRLSPVPNLIDSTTGRYLPSALDPFYFLRVSEHILDGGILNETDNMRYLGASKYSTELISYANVYLYKTVSLFTTIDFRYFNIISPVIYFALAMIIFYFFMVRLLNSRYGAIIATTCLSFSSLFLQRTAAGFSDHEAIGVLFFFISLYLLSEFFYSGKDKNIIFSAIKRYLLFPLSVVLTLYSWGGIVRIMFIIYPIFFFLINLKYILLRLQGLGDDLEYDYIFLQDFMMTFIAMNIIVWFFGLFGAFPYSGFLNSYILSQMGVGIQFMIVYCIITFITYSIYKIYPKIFNKDKLPMITFIVTVVVGLIGSIVTGKLVAIINFIQSPLLKSRIGQTVAENQAITIFSMKDQVGIYFFLMFIIAAIMILYPFVSAIIKKYNTKKNDVAFIERKNFFLLTLLIVTLYALNSSLRMMFVNTILLSIFTGVVVSRSFNAFYKCKDNMARMLAVSILILILLTSIFNIYSFAIISSLQSKTIGPSANADWQKAMKWVRENTTEDSLFIHWWDYGYWIQTLGERPTVTDGGHVTTYWDHLIGRYLLTTPNPESAYQMFNTYGADYFLVDPSDVGKYSAYSSIGDNEPDTDDRTSYIGQFFKNNAATQETNNSTILIYGGQMLFDEDYVVNGYLLPEYKSAIVQLQVKINNNGTFEDIIGVAVDQSGIPVYIKYRYIYLNGQVYDFGEGYEGMVRFVMSYDGANTDTLGGALVLTPSVRKSFFARTYLTGELESDYMEIAYQGPTYTGLDRFLFVQNRLIGPIVIYKIKDNPYGTNPGFLELKGKYSAFDELYYK